MNMLDFIYDVGPFIEINLKCKKTQKKFSPNLYYKILNILRR